jgi:thymidylate synthase ThyX
MSELRVNGKSEDGLYLSLLDSDGKKFSVRISDTLRSTVNQPRLMSVQDEEAAPVSVKEIQCLDKGFVKLIDVMPRIVPDGQTCDYAIAQMARVSYGAGTKSVSEDKGLIRYLLRHSHTSPIEAIDFKFAMKMPLFIARQMFRHRTACLSGDSLLYFDEPAAIKKNKRNFESTDDDWMEKNVRELK